MHKGSQSKTPIPTNLWVEYKTKVPLGGFRGETQEKTIPGEFKHKKKKGALCLFIV